MKTIAGGIACFFLGMSVGVCQYYMVDGWLNQSARAAGAQQLSQQRAQLEMLQQLCPEVLQKAQGKK